MWPAIVAALVGRKLQRDEENAQRRQASKMQLAKAMEAIAAQRASRAGDSGYMQTGISGFSGMPMGPRSSGNAMLAQVGSALMSQDAEPSAPATNGGGGGGGVFSTPQRWAGQDEDELKWGNYA